MDPIEQSVNGGKNSECLYLFPIKKTEPDTKRAGAEKLSPVSIFNNADHGGTQ
jgi:hypothetical protein